MKQVTPDGTSTIYIGQWYEESQSLSKGRVRTNYYYLGGQRVALRRGGVVYYLHADPLGSLSEVTAADRGVSARQRYYPYGQVRYLWGSLPTTYNFTGQRLDASTGLLYYGARYYDPALMRFTQPDTLVPDPANPQSLNRYSYTLNNPLKYIDPSGHVYIIGTTPEYGLLFAGPGCGCNLGTQVYGSGDELANTMKLVATAVDMTPVVGDAKGFVEVFTGHDLITGDDLGNWRWLGLLGISELRPLRYTDEVVEAAGIGKQLPLPGFELGNTANKAGRPVRHHIATNKNWLRDPRWSERFQKLFAEGGMSLDDAANIVELPAELHKGSHAQEYHQWVYQELRKAIAGLDDPAQIRAALESRLRAIAEELKAHPEWLRNPPMQGGR